MKTARCSSLPLLWACPSSQEPEPGEVLVNESSEAAEVGNAYHRWMASHVTGIDLDQAALAKEHGCDLDELRMLCAMGCKALGELMKHFHAAEALPQTEVRLASVHGGEIEIVGTGDFVSRSGRTAVVLDWKTGRVDAEYTHQTRGYAYGAVEMLDVDEVVVITVWVRQGVWDVEKITLPQLRDWSQELLRRIRNGRGTFNPGAHCGYCPRRVSCPGRAAMVRSSIADLTKDGLPVIAWTPETRAELGPQIGEMFGRVKLIEKAAEDFRATLKADVIDHGPISIGGGRQLAILDVNKRVLDTAKARDVIGEFIGRPALDAATTISLSACEAAAAEAAGKGKGAQAKRDMTAALEAAGAISVNRVQQLRECKA